MKVEDNALDISYLGSNVKDIRKYSVTSESELPVTSSSDSETPTALIPGKGKQPWSRSALKEEYILLANVRFHIFSCFSFLVKTILLFLVGRRKLSSRKKKTSGQGSTEHRHSDSSDISYTDIFKDLFTKDSPYNEQQPNGKGIYLLARMNEHVPEYYLGCC